MMYTRLFLSLFILFLVCFIKSNGENHAELGESSQDNILDKFGVNENEILNDDKVDSELTVDVNKYDENQEEPLDEIEISNFENYDDVVEEKGNVTLTEPINEPKPKVYRNCVTGKTYGTVEVVNATRLMELLIMEPSNRTDASKSSDEKDDNKLTNGKTNSTTCVLVLFYARWCLFSSQAAPHFNALARYFSDIKIVAIDASKYQSFNTQFGIVGVPTIMFVYNGKASFRFNDTSYNLEAFSKFVTEYTGLEPSGSIYVNSSDFGGPVPSVPSNSFDYYLVLSWIFIAACGFYFTLQSQWWKQFVELVQNTWRESNAQHEHTD